MAFKTISRLFLVLGILYQYHLLHTSVSTILAARELKKCKVNTVGGLEYSLLFTPIEYYKDDIFGGEWISAPNEFGRCRLNNTINSPSILSGQFTQTLPFKTYVDQNNKTGFHSVELVQVSLFPEDGLSYGGSAVAMVSSNGTQSLVGTQGVEGKCLFEVRSNFYNRSCFVDPKILYYIFLTYWTGLIAIALVLLVVLTVKVHFLNLWYFVAVIMIKLSIPLPTSLYFCNEMTGLPCYTNPERPSFKLGPKPYISNRKSESFNNINGERYVILDNIIFKIYKGETTAIARRLTVEQLENLKCYIWELSEMLNPCMDNINSFYSHCLTFEEIISKMSENNQLFVSSFYSRNKKTALGNGFDFNSIQKLFPKIEHEYLFRMYEHNLKFFYSGLGDFNSLLLALKGKTYYNYKPENVKNSQWKLYTSDVSKLKMSFGVSSYFSDYRAPTQALKSTLEQPVVKNYQQPLIKTESLTHEADNSKQLVVMTLGNTKIGEFETCQPENPQKICKKQKLVQQRAIKRTEVLTIIETVQNLDNLSAEEIEVASKLDNLKRSIDLKEAGLSNRAKKNLNKEEKTQLYLLGKELERLEKVRTTGMTKQELCSKLLPEFQISIDQIFFIDKELSNLKEAEARADEASKKPVGGQEMVKSSDFIKLLKIKPRNNGSSSRTFTKEVSKPGRKVGYTDGVGIKKLIIEGSKDLKAAIQANKKGAFFPKRNLKMSYKHSSFLKKRLLPSRAALISLLKKTNIINIKMGKSALKDERVINAIKSLDPPFRKNNYSDQDLERHFTGFSNLVSKFIYGPKYKNPQKSRKNNENEGGNNPQKRRKWTSPQAVIEMSDWFLYKLPKKMGSRGALLMSILNRQND